MKKLNEWLICSLLSATLIGGKSLADRCDTQNDAFVQDVQTAATIGNAEKYSQNCNSNAVEQYGEALPTAQTTMDGELAQYAKSAYLSEFKSGSEIFAKNAEDRLPIASMCKIMTLLLCFEAIDSGNLAFDGTVTVSENAAGMGGSQIFLEAGGEYRVKDLMKSIAVCSANDACVALAESLSGSESAFVDAMNAKAKQLNMTNTLFANCTGLPKEPQYSCAKDVATMLKALLCHEEYFSLCNVWMEQFQHPKGRTTEMTNTNKLIRFYPGCDGGKTGFTSEAGFCLAATANRGGMRLISVVIGEDSGKHRFSDTSALFDYAFGAYVLKTAVDENEPLTEKISVRGGKIGECSIKAERDSYVFGKKGEKENVTIEKILPPFIKAPVRSGDAIGEIVVYKENVEIDRLSIVANETVAKANFFDRFKDILGAK